jgi:UDPglucose 6-dehydrogenase
VDGAFIEALLDYNAQRPQWIHRQLEEHLFGEVAHPSVAVWGLAYKKNTRSTKNSVAVRVIRELGDRADVRAYDPVVRTEETDLRVKVATDRDEALTGADCLRVLTDWDEFAVPDPTALRSMRRPLIIDGVGVVDAARADLRGIRLVQMGRPSRA